MKWPQYWIFSPSVIGVEFLFEHKFYLMYQKNNESCAITVRPLTEEEIKNV